MVDRVSVPVACLLLAAACFFAVVASSGIVRFIDDCKRAAYLRAPRHHTGRDTDGVLPAGPYDWASEDDAA